MKSGVYFFKCLFHIRSTVFLWESYVIIQTIMPFCVQWRQYKLGWHHYWCFHRWGRYLHIHRYLWWKVIFIDGYLLIFKHASRILDTNFLIISVLFFPIVFKSKVQSGYSELRKLRLDTSAKFVFGATCFVWDMQFRCNRSICEKIQISRYLLFVKDEITRHCNKRSVF